MLRKVRSLGWGGEEELHSDGFLAGACPACENPVVLCPVGTEEPSEFRMFLHC